MKGIIKTGIEGLVIIEPRLFGDSRGYFFESFSQKDFKQNVLEVSDNLHPDNSHTPFFVQDNESFSNYGVLRGLHFQKPPYAQGKLVRVISGKVLDVAVDLRRGSPTFGKYSAVELSGENKLQFYIPEGFAHGFSVLSEEVLFQYKCTNYYNQNSEGGILWNDKTLNINWRVPLDKILISDKDRVQMTFDEYCKSPIF